MSENGKNLANCKPSEFLTQTNKIRKAVENWLNVTDIMNIRRRVPDLKKIDDNMSQDEIDKVKEYNKKMLAEQGKKNALEILDNIMDKHPQETLELLALLCFIDPKEVDDYPVTFYLANLTDIMNNDDVLGFFTSLVQLGQMGIFD